MSITELIMELIMELIIWKTQVEIDKLIISLETLKIFLRYDGDPSWEGGIYSE